MYNSIQISICDPFNPVAVCMSADATFELKVVVYVGATSFISNPVVSTVANSTLMVSNLLTTTSTASIMVSWNKYSNLSFSVVWVEFASAFNGYLSANDVNFNQEIRDFNATNRLLLSPTISEVLFSGCYTLPNGNTHCIQPYTYYRISVSAVVDNVYGTPLQTIVRTQQAVPLSPEHVNVVCTWISYMCYVLLFNAMICT